MYTHFVKNRFIPLLLCSLPIFLFGWLAWSNLIPTGVFTIVKHPGERSAFVDEMLPETRVKGRVLHGDPVFFFVHPHRGFETIEIELRYKNTGVPIVEMGALASTHPDVYDLKPVENQIIDQSTWKKIEENGMLLLQRNSVFQTMKEFFENLPPREKIAVYHAKLPIPYRDRRYAPSVKHVEHDIAFFGSQELKVYVKNEPLDFRFLYDDGDVSAILLDENGHAVKEFIGGDGEVRVHALDLSEGVYKIQLRAQPFVRFHRVRTFQTKWIFLNQIHFADAARVWTDAVELSAVTDRAEGTQTIQNGSQQIMLANPFENVRFETRGSVLSVPKGRVKVWGNGNFSVSESTLFRPDPVRLTSSTSLDTQEIDYILASYQPPVQDGQWKVAHVQFDSSVLLMQEGAWKFVFSLPGIDTFDKTIEVDYSTIIMKRMPVWPFN